MTGSPGRPERFSPAALFVRRVQELVKRPPVTADPGQPVAALARLMTERAVGSVVVVDHGGAPVGIVTDRDLRRKVVAAGRPAADTVASAIMSAPLITIRPDAFAFEAVLEMTRAGIHHLPVVDGPRLLGLVSSHDFLLLQAPHPVALAREIERAESVPALRELAARVTGLVGPFVAEGGAPYDVGQLVAELNDRLVRRVVALVESQPGAGARGAAPVPYCWLAFGSEGRREQTLRTDQDHGLVYEDPPTGAAAEVQAHFQWLGAAVTRALVDVGFPPCPGEIMASNPRWCQPVSEWVVTVQRWMEGPTPEHVLAASIFFDLRPVAGTLDLGARLAHVARGAAPGHSLFLRRLAEEVATSRLPLTVLGRLAVARRGPARGTVDLKRAGAFQLVAAGRLHALALGLAETNTIDRFRAAASRGLYPDAELGDVVDAYQHLLRLRLRHQLGQVERGEAPDNRLDPRRLSRAEALLLRDALRTTARVQAAIGERYAVSLLT